MAEIKTQRKGRKSASPATAGLAPKEVAFIIDKSGSMASCRTQVISGYNEFIQDLKAEKGLKISFWLTFFDTRIDHRIHGKTIEDVPDLTVSTYVPGDCTALYDALGTTLVLMETRLKGDTTTPITVVVMTDGQENSSREWDEKKIRALIARLDKLPNWTFAFMGADQDAWIAASKMGLPEGNTMSYSSRSTGETMTTNTRAVTAHLVSGELKTSQLYSPGGSGLADTNTAIAPEPVKNPFAPRKLRK